MSREERLAREVGRLARDEIETEDFDAAVVSEKTRIRKHVPLWHRIFPWTITIERRKYNDDK
jgi:hypothetical protein